MRFILFIPVFIFANFFDLAKHIVSSYEYKLSTTDTQIAHANASLAQMKKYGQITLEYQYARNLKTPYVVIYDTNFPSSPKHFRFDISYSYPIFGYHISDMIQIANLQLIQSQLKQQNLKQVLSLKLAKLYANLYAINKQIAALNTAKESLWTLREKLQIFYQNKLITHSRLDKIVAKYYDTLSEISKAKAQKEALLNQIFLLTSIRVKECKLDNIQLHAPKFTQRNDVKAIRTTLNIDKYRIQLHKNYPKLSLLARYAKDGNNYTATTNDFQNPNQSIIALSMQWDFDMTKTYQTQIAKLQKRRDMLFYKQYLQQIKIQYQNDFAFLHALYDRLRSAKKAYRANASYYDDIKAKFLQNLVDSVKLNEALSKLTYSKSNVDMIKSQIFFYKIKLLFDGGTL
ncbi:MAG: TolC family protein [Epsilonproteobacteria bacterium]|nr:TolC family protein [Campylobacterota bacterium]